MCDSKGQTVESSQCEWALLLLPHSLQHGVLGFMICWFSKWKMISWCFNLYFSSLPKLNTFFIYSFPTCELSDHACFFFLKKFFFFQEQFLVHSRVERKIQISHMPSTLTHAEHPPYRHPSTESTLVTTDRLHWHMIIIQSLSFTFYSLCCSFYGFG